MSENPLPLCKYFAEEMPRTRLLLLSLACLLAAACGRDRYVALSGYAQGGTYTVKYNGTQTRVRPAEVSAAVDSILREIDFSLSGYNKASLLSRFNAGETIVPDRHFLEMYRVSYDCWEETEGALDVAAGPVFDIWGFGFTRDSMPSPDRIGTALLHSGLRRCRPDILQALGPDGSLRPADLLRPGLAGPPPVLNFNALAQGYSSDCVAGYLRSIGVSDMLVDIGEIFCSGRNPSGKGWSVGIDHPEDGNNTPGARLDGIWTSGGGSYGIVTSGNYRKFYVRDGRKYAHTLDPRTGWPVDHSLLSATVTAPDATRADALATACMVWGPDRARALIEAHDDLEACLITADSIWVSSGFNRL